jgi:catalase (peroxidase I)
MSKNGDFEAVRKDIAKLMHQPEYDDGSAGPVLVRLAWYVCSKSNFPSFSTPSTTR